MLTEGEEGTLWEIPDLLILPKGTVDGEDPLLIIIKDPLEVVKPVEGIMWEISMEIEKIVEISRLLLQKIKLFLSCDEVVDLLLINYHLICIKY